MVVFLVTCKHLVIAVVVVVLDSIWTIYCMVVVDIAVVVVLEGVVMVLVVVVVGCCVDFSARSCCHGGVLIVSIVVSEKVGVVFWRISRKKRNCTVEELFY